MSLETMRKRWVALTAAAAAAAAGCSDKPKRQPLVVVDAGSPPAPMLGPRITQLRPPAQELGATPVLPEPALALPLRESFTVEEAGQEPRRRLRYALDGRARRITLAAELSARSVTGTAAQPTPVAIPPFRERFTVQVERRGGRERWSWRGEPIELSGEREQDKIAAAPYVLRWKQLLANRNATFSLDEHALPRDLTFAEDPLREHSDAERDELTQRLLGQLVPLPEQPIGVGARWRAVTILRQGFVSVKQTAAYQLVALDGDRLTLAVDLRRVAGEQLVALPQAPSGAQLELVALFRATAGTLHVELDAALPTEGELTLEARSHQRLTEESGKVSELITEDLGALRWSSEVLP